MDKARLKELCENATPPNWELWTGCSWRRFGSSFTGDTIIEPTNHHLDGHPDLLFRNQFDWEFIIASRTALPALLEENEELETALAHERERTARLFAEVERLKEDLVGENPFARMMEDETEGTPT